MMVKLSNITIEKSAIAAMVDKTVPKLTEPHK